MNIKGFIDDLGEALEENKSTVYIVLGVTSFLLSIGVTAVEAPEIKKSFLDAKRNLKKINEAYEEDEIDEDEFKAAKKEVYLTAGKDIGKRTLPIVSLAASGTYCVLNSHHIDQNEIAGLTTTLQVTEASKRLYREQVIKKIGEKKEREVVDAVHQEEVKRTKKPDEKKIPVLETNKPATLCFDPYSGRYFRCSVDRIESAINTINAIMLHNMTQIVDLNDFYDEIGIPRVKGDVKGWNSDNGCFRLRPTTALTEDNEPCMVVDFDIEPTYM